MGLTICKNIVEKNSGFIDFFSKGENLGATFMFSMKMNLPSESISAAQLILSDEQQVDNSSEQKVSL